MSLYAFTRIRSFVPIAAEKRREIIRVKCSPQRENKRKNAPVTVKPAAAVGNFRQRLAFYRICAFTLYIIYVYTYAKVFF